jgi:hypothetical protein
MNSAASSSRNPNQSRSSLVIVFAVALGFGIAMPGQAALAGVDGASTAKAQFGVAGDSRSSGAIVLAEKDGGNWNNGKKNWNKGDNWNKNNKQWSGKQSYNQNYNKYYNKHWGKGWSNYNNQWNKNWNGALMYAIGIAGRLRRVRRLH